MKRMLFSLAAALITTTVFCQLKTTKVCPTIYVDVLKGKVNEVQADYTQGQIKSGLPCFTSEEPENSTSSCGGVINYKDKGIYFYTGRDYVEIRDNFKGKLSLPLMGAARTSLFKTLGHPKIKDVKWDAFQTQYGTLILYYNAANRINKIQITTKSTETIQLCQ